MASIGGMFGRFGGFVGRVMSTKKAVPGPKTDAFGEKLSDPLEAIVKIVLGTGLGLGVLLCWRPKVGVGATTIFAGLTAWAYMKAPARSYPEAEDIMEGVSLEGKVAMVTGPTNGIGLETARALAKKGAHVIMVARSEKKLQAAKASIDGKLTTFICDLADLESVQRCAKDFLELKLPLHLLINNAGVMALPDRQATKQGLEMQCGVCHVGHFFLTKLLEDVLIASAPSRVVCLTSSGHRYHRGPTWLEDPILDTVPYQPWIAYGNAKLANMLHARALSDRLKAKGVTAYSVMPGGIHTGLQDSVDLWTMFKWTLAGPFFFKSWSQGAATTLLCAVSDTVLPHSGKYFNNTAPTETTENLLTRLGDDAPSRSWDATVALLKDLGFPV